MDKQRFQRKAPAGWMTASEVLAAFGCSRATLYRIIGEGGFTTDETIMFRGKRVFRREAVTKYIDEQIALSSGN